ncbi:NAD(P)-dependent oxidoreductase [Pannus brasiliensis CCIBt3594]|uniref:NAD(P)-dependent oxidoreductase n=1 Tax=Pannus brasiliensis CCIBt3594 TaxID=1427578 RepID=A0AAW9QZX9_9CHRO
MKKIFLTGASGCIGHYIAEDLIQETDHELYLLVRNPEKLKFDYKARENIHILVGDMREIDRYQDILKTINIAILAATSWGGEEETYQINVVQTLALMNYLDPEVCERVLYFSTASILNQQNQLLPEAGKIGTNYIRTKYLCYSKISELKIADRVTALYPTLVLGGDETKPYSHLYGGLPDVLKYIGLVRWFQADGSFHFIHAKDISRVVLHFIDHEAPEKKIVLGNQRTTANQGVEEICAYLNQRIYFRIPLSIALANFFIKVFNLKMEEWDRFSMNYRHFTHARTYTPASFGLENYCSTLDDVLALRGIEKKG